MDRDGLTEQAAFSYVQQAAMQNRQTMKAVAQRILDGDGRPEAAGAGRARL